MRTWSRIVILTIAIFAFTLAVSAIGFWKYAHYRYGGMDLAIYTNVLHQLSFPPSLGEGEREGVGQWHSSIQGGSYLGDHVEPILLLIAPFFRLWPDPRLLLILQALALGLTAIPISLLLARRENSKSEARNSKQIQNSNFKTSDLFRISDFGFRISWPAVLAGLWLLNPLLWNAALFEFHALAFAPLFLLSATYAYLRRKFWPFLLFLLLSLSVREDIALIVVMFGIIASIEWWRARRQRGARAIRRAISGGVAAVACCAAWGALESTAADSRRGIPHASEAQRPTSGATGAERWHRDLSWRFAIFSIILGFVWFVIATRIAAAHSPSGAYKFLVYYGWLRDAASHPLSLLRHFLSIGNLDMGVGLLLPFLFLPLLRPRWLLLALPPLLQILLAEPGGSNVVVELHYGLLFLPALVLAAADTMTYERRPRGTVPTRQKSEARNPKSETNSKFEFFKFEHSELFRDSNFEFRISRIERWFAQRFPLPKPFAITLGIATYLAAAWLLGPFPGIANVAVRGASPDDRARAAAYDELLQIVQSRALDTSGVSIAAGYAALPHIAARAHAYGLPYAYLGVNQYAFAPYVLPDDVQYVMLDQRDALAYAVQFPSVRWSAPYAAEGPARLQKIIADGRFGIVAERDGVALLKRSLFTERAERVSAKGGCASGAEASSCNLDARYLAPDHPVRGRLIIDPLRDIVVQFVR